MIRIASILLLLDAPLNALAQERILHAVPVQTPPRIDGILDEPVWNRPGESGFVQRQPREGAPSTEKTEIWFAYDHNAFYVAARMFDHPDSVVGRLVRRDEDFQSDFLYIGIDPKRDRSTGYFFGTNPSGAIGDGVFYDDNKTDDSYDPIWDLGVHRDSLGWTVEFRIPYSQLRFSTQPVYVWGVEAYRRIHRKNEESFFTLHPRNDDIRVSRWPELHGIQGISPPPRIEIRPYVSLTGKFLQRPPVGSFNEGRKDPFVLGRDYLGSVGADMKIGLGGNLTLDASVNPDFAQVEVDPAVVNLTAYETYYAEKRPFFVEGSNILSFGRGGAASYVDINWTDPAFFYSRRIGRAPRGTSGHSGFQDIPDRTTILGAAKISGKTSGGFSVAGLAALTDREFGRTDSAGFRFAEEIEPLTLCGVARAQQHSSDSRQGIGVITTLVGRDLRDPRLNLILARRAFSMGVDGWSFLDTDKNWILTGWAGLTSVQGTKSYLLSLQHSPQHYFQRPDADHVGIDSGATSLTGWAGRVWLHKDKGNWRFSAAAGFVHPSFEANDMGFHSYSDIVNFNLYSGYYWFEPDSFLRTKSVSTAYLREHNFGGVKTGETFFFGVDAELLSYWGGWFSVGYNNMYAEDRKTRGGPLMKGLPSYFGYLGFYSDSRSDAYGTLVLFGDRGQSDAWDYSFDLKMNWRVTPTLNLSFGPSYTRNYSTAQYVETSANPSAAETYGMAYIFSSLDLRTVAATLRAYWTFTPTMSLQAYVQPYLSAGKYSGFKRLERPFSFSFVPASPSSDPTFNFKSLRMNIVFRWEYLPGSTLYLVWTNSKVHFEQQQGAFRLGRDFTEMLRARPDNVFSLKLTYWWSP